MADEVETPPVPVPEQKSDEATATNAADSTSGFQRSRRNGKSQDKKPIDRRPQGRKKYQTNNTQQKESSDPVEIRKQVEFYFSDSNLAYDDFMNKLVGGTENKAVPIETIHSFRRMRHFQPYSAVVAALKESTTLNIVGEKDELIQRKEAFVPPELDDEFNDPSLNRSIYAKGFGSEEKPSTQVDIEQFFAPYGPVNMVRMRRKLPKKDFKGSVFVEFKTEELQNTFLKLESKPKWNGKDLQIMSKEEYCKSKLDDVKSGKIPADKAHYYKQYLPKTESDSRVDKKESNGSHRRGNKGGRDKRSNRDRDDWKGRRDDFQKKRESKDDLEHDEKTTEAGANVDESAAPSSKRVRDDVEDAGGSKPEEKKTKTDAVDT